MTCLRCKQEDVKMKPLFIFRPSLFLLVILSLFVVPTFVLCSVDQNQPELLELPKVVGPESIAFDCRGEGPYTGVSDGRILKWQGSHLGWTEFAVASPYRLRFLCDGSTNPNLEPICGRPLGLKFNPITCELYIADAYFGLQKVGPNGGVAQQLATSAEGIPFRFTNGLDIDSQTGMVYFTDTSMIFQRRAYIGSTNSREHTGRLMQYDPQTKRVTVLLRGLAFANGVALSKDNSFLLVAESTTYRILKFWLRGDKVHTSELFAQLERSPDNIKRNTNGEFWIAMNTGRDLFHTPIEKLDPVGIKVDGEGKEVEVLDGHGGTELSSVSEIEEHDGRLWLGSALKPYMAVIKL
ncbi:hypothetical protein FEM48_Zijuj10G0135000 [Ziziphus jujuba var. spinosa]|uniref:Strictosidine synthase conserved region domain-containing protein n=1 Tax=Ziziphus jujuba var. spinosa TaxID=714518 RepID=A0A978UNN4_ZIZJJ|nr:hypothetical protein FEM48_Zijuj10G0135000 [Ziziphus jujuba var. spinosa]